MRRRGGLSRERTLHVKGKKGEGCDPPAFVSKRQLCGKDEERIVSKKKRACFSRAKRDTALCNAKRRALQRHETASRNSLCEAAWEREQPQRETAAFFARTGGGGGG